MTRYVFILLAAVVVAGIVCAQETPKTPPNSQAQKDAVRENWDNLQSAWNAIDDWKTGPAHGPENAAEIEKTLLYLAARTAKSLSEAGLGGNDLKPFEASLRRTFLERLRCLVSGKAEVRTRVMDSLGARWWKDEAYTEGRLELEGVYEKLWQARQSGTPGEETLRNAARDVGTAVRKSGIVTPATPRWAMSRLIRAITSLAMGLPFGPPDVPPELRETIAKLVTQLGSDDVEVREHATRQLTDIGEPAVEALMEAAVSDDPEVRLRANCVLAAESGPGTGGQADNELMERLKSVRMTMDIKETPLTGVIDSFREFQRVDIVFDVGVDPAEADCVTLKLSDCPLSEVLAEVLRLAGDLAYEVSDGVIVITKGKGR